MPIFPLVVFAATSFQYLSLYLNFLSSGWTFHQEADKLAKHPVSTHTRRKIGNISYCLSPHLSYVNGDI